MKSNGLNSEAPYPGLSVERVVERVSNFRQPRNIHQPQQTSPSSFYSSAQTDSKLLGGSTKQEIENAISKLQGLVLSLSL